MKDEKLKLCESNKTQAKNLKVMTKFGEKTKKMTKIQFTKIKSKKILLYYQKSSCILGCVKFYSMAPPRLKM